VEGIPLTRMEKKVEIIRLITYLTHREEKPKEINIFLIYFYLKLSKVLERSIFRSIPIFLDCLRND